MRCLLICEHTALPSSCRVSLFEIFSSSAHYNVEHISKISLIHFDIKCVEKLEENGSTMNQTRSMQRQTFENEKRVRAVHHQNS